MHRDAIEKLLFARQEITDYDLFDEDGEWRLLRFCAGEGVNVEAEDVERIVGMHKLFEERLVTLFRKKLVTDRSYINHFVHYCIGMPYIPDLDINTDFNITVEYNNIKKEKMSNPGALPVAHTCTQELKIPLLAYDADIDVFEQKMDMALKNAEDSFNMS